MFELEHDSVGECMILLVIESRMRTVIAGARAQVGAYFDIKAAFAIFTRHGGGIVASYSQAVYIQAISSLRTI